MDSKILTSYSFIASLNENGTDFYNTVYIPLCKRAMSLFAKRSTKGRDIDIQAIVKEEYGIEIPLMITQKMIIAIGKELSRKEKVKFGYKCFESGKSFQFESYTFTSLEESYERERRLANALQTAFEEFVKLEKKDIETIPSFADFILRYKNELSSFLSGRNKNTNELEIDVSYMPHVRFLQYIESNNDALYKVVEHIYIGAIIASYIEANVDLEAKAGKGITYFLDTKVVLEALDLQNQEDTRPTLELLQLIKESGGEIRILDVTLHEIQGLINIAINNFNKHNPTTTINEACLRIGKNKTWLTQVNGQLEKYLTDKLKVNFSKVSESDLKEFSSSEDADLLRKIWYRKNAAAHDVIAYLYVRKRRKQDTNRTIIQKASSWFITANRRLCKFNISRKENGYPCEIVMPQEVTSLLFLQNPKKYETKVSNIGLGELIAQTLFEEYPSKDIINEFDIAIRENTNISSDDYAILLSAVSQESTSKLQKLLEKNVNDKDCFISEIHAIIARERKKQLELENQRKKAIELHSQDEVEKQDLKNANQKLSEKLDAISKQVADMQEATNNEIKNRVEKEKRDRKQHLIIYSFLIALIITLSIVIIQQSVNIIGWLNNVLNVIKSLGGVWTFIGLIITIISKIRK